MKLAYCDFIASKIRNSLLSATRSGDVQVSLSQVLPTRWDLSDEGRFLSTKKTILVADSNDKWYRVTVEEV